MLTAIAIITLATAYIAMSLLGIWAIKQDRLDWEARLLTASLVAVLTLTAINVAERTWWAVAVWAINAILVARNLRGVNRMRAEDEADEVYTA